MHKLGDIIPRWLKELILNFVELKRHMEMSGIYRGRLMNGANVGCRDIVTVVGCFW